MMPMAFYGHTIDSTDGLAAAFAAALADWKTQQRNASLQRSNATREYAAAMTVATATSAEKRKAEADAQTVGVMLVADQAEVDARGARYLVEFLVGLAGGTPKLER